MGHINDHIKATLGPIYGTTLNVTELLKAWREAEGIANQAAEQATYASASASTVFNDDKHAYWAA